MMSGVKISPRTNQPLSPLNHDDDDDDDHSDGDNDYDNDDDDEDDGNDDGINDDTDVDDDDVSNRRKLKDENNSGLCNNTFLQLLFVTTIIAKVFSSK